MIRGFKEVDKEFKKNDGETKLPLRGSSRSAGYDFYSKETVVIQPGEWYLFWSDIKSYMLDGESLEIHIRSSIGIKEDLILKNSVSIIDQDYYSNPDNDGNISMVLFNISKEPRTIEAGDRIAQGVFRKFLEADDFNSNVEFKERTGGIGSTGKK